MNKYPIALERSVADEYKYAFKQIAIDLQKEILADLDADYSLRLREPHKQSIVQDSVFNIFSKLNAFAQKNFPEVYQNLQNNLIGKFTQVDSWVKSKIQESINEKSHLLNLVRPKQLAVVNGEIKYIHKPLEKKIVTENGIVKVKYETQGLAINPLKNQIEKSNRMMSDKIKDQAVKSADLIKGIQQEASQKLAKRISDAYNAGKTKDQIKEIVQKTIQVSEGRAGNIAGDQVQKFANAVNRERQQAIGIKKFTWRTMGDNRVRDSHQHLEGKVFDWETGAQGLLDMPESKFPGDDANCRCNAEPYEDELTEEEQKIASKIKVKIKL